MGSSSFCTETFFCKTSEQPQTGLEHSVWVGPLWATESFKRCFHLPQHNFHKGSRQRNGSGNRLLVHLWECNRWQAGRVCRQVAKPGNVHVERSQRAPSCKLAKNQDCRPRSPNQADKSAEKHHQMGSHPLQVVLKKVHKLKNHQFQRQTMVVF